jgi:prepilin-type N-terminal cleavage/methylation domain-containing protein
MIAASTTHNDNGFTLVEMLVVIILLALIVVALSGGLRFGARVWETTNSIATTEEHNEFGTDLLRQLLANAEPITRGAYVEFEGHRSAVSFETIAPPALGVAGLAHVELRFGDKGSLVIKMSAARRPDVTRTAIVSTGLEAPRFSYLDASESRPIWLALWRDRDRLPDAIRIDADGARPSGAWPLFIAQLPLEQRPDCMFDPVSLNCRAE